MPAVSLLIKPASSLCNMQCSYCFYHDLATYQTETMPAKIMSLATVQQLISQLFQYATEQVSILFQGGEPTLAGLAYFQAFVAMVNQYNIQKLPVLYRLQTNGTCIDIDWCRFFNEHNFLIGISLDGNAEIHDYLRKTNGIGSYQNVLQSIAMLKKNNVPYNILTVATKQVAKHMRSIYATYKKAGYRYLQLIACLNPLSKEKQPYSVTAEQYGNCLIELFDQWIADYHSGKDISIRFFDNILNRLAGKPTELCSLAGGCGTMYVVEANGDVFPCDFFCLDEYCLGNCHTHTFAQMAVGSNVKKFFAKTDAMRHSCHGCQLEWICKGGCAREFVNDKNMFCHSYQLLYGHILKNHAQLVHPTR